MSKFRSKHPDGNARTVYVSFVPETVGESQTVLRLEERVTALFDELRVPVFRYLLCMNISPQETEEIIQDTFLKFYQHLHSGGRDDNPRGWIFHVAHNSGLKNIRNRKLHFSIGEEPWSERAEAAADPATSPEEAVLKKEKMKLLYEVIVTLPPKQRQCLLLRTEGFRYREIAEILQVTVPTVAESVRRAMDKIMRQFHD